MADIDRRSAFFAGEIDELDEREARNANALRREIADFRREFQAFRDTTSTKANQVLAVLATGAVLAAVNIVLLMTRGPS